MRLLFRLLLVVPLMSACDRPTPPSAPMFEASGPKPLAEPDTDALGTRQDGPAKTTIKWRYRRSSSFETARSPGLTSPETTRRVRAPSNS